MFRKVFWMLLLIVFTMSGCAETTNKLNLYESILKKDTIVVGTSFYAKPFSFKDSKGQLQGIEVDLAREIANRMLGSKNKVIFKNINPQDRMKAVMSGDVDMVLSTMTITKQRKKLVNFSEPYFVAGQAICVKKDSKIETIDDLINKRVIVVLGTTGEQNIRRFVPTVLIKAYIDNSETLSAFKSGYGDAITTDDALLQGLVMDNKNYMILPERLTEEPYGIAFEKSRRANSFKKHLNEVLNEIQVDGTLDTIKEKWGIY